LIKFNSYDNISQSTDFDMNRCISYNGVRFLKSNSLPENIEYHSSPIEVNKDLEIQLGIEETNAKLRHEKQMILNKIPLKYKRNHLRITVSNNVLFQDSQITPITNNYECSEGSKSICSEFSQLSQRYLKNYQSNSDIIDVNSQLLPKDAKISNFFEKINLKKNIFNIRPEDIKNLELSPETDHFIIRILSLFEQSDIPKDELINRLVDDYSYRYEAVYFKVCLMLNELRFGKCDKQKVKEKINILLRDSNENLMISKYFFQS